GFAKMSDADIVARGAAVNQSMTANLNYKNPPVDLATLKAALDAYSAAIAEGLDEGKRAIAERKNKRAVVINMLRLLARYVETHCKDDMAIFTSSGFEPASMVRALPQPLAQPTVRKIEQGPNSGQLLLRVTPVPKARMYEMRHAPLGDGG